jgi:hypothetical protein
VQLSCSQAVRLSLLRGRVLLCVACWYMFGAGGRGEVALLLAASHWLLRQGPVCRRGALCSGAACRQLSLVGGRATLCTT